MTFQKRALRTHLVNSLQKQHTYTSIRLHNPSLHALHVFVFACVKLQLYRCPASKAMLTDRHARGQPSTCVHHKDFSCLTTGCPAQHVALVTKPTLLAGTPFISLRNTEDDRRCFPRWAAKWLPLSKSRGCTWLMDPSVSCEIVHTWRGQTGRKDKRQEERDEKKKKSCLDVMPKEGPASRSDFKWPLCEMWFQMLTIWLLSHPYLP